MEEGGLTLFDWIVISVVGLSALLALFRGFIREVLSLATWLIAAFVTINFYDSVREMLTPLIDSKMFVLGLSTVGLFVLVLVLLSILNALIMRFLQAGSDISILDSALGMCFGVVRGLFILSLAYIMFSVVMPKDDFPDMVANARTLPVIEYSANLLGTMVPRLKEMGAVAKEEGERMAREQAEEELERMKKDPSYNKDKRMDLERLLETLDGRVKNTPQQTDNTEKQESL